jgi:hypothetical protein
MVVKPQKDAEVAKRWISRFVDWEIWRLVDWGLFADTGHQVSEHGACRILRREAALDCAASAALSFFSPHNLGLLLKNSFQ